MSFILQVFVHKPNYWTKLNFWPNDGTEFTVWLGGHSFYMSWKFTYTASIKLWYRDAGFGAVWQPQSRLLNFSNEGFWSHSLSSLKMIGFDAVTQWCSEGQGNQIASDNVSGRTGSNPSWPRAPDSFCGCRVGWGGGVVVVVMGLPAEWREISPRQRKWLNIVSHIIMTH